MKTWNTPELTVLEISETAKTEICNITGTACINDKNNANANSWGQCKFCSVYLNQNGTGTGTGTNTGTGSSDDEFLDDRS